MFFKHVRSWFSYIIKLAMYPRPLPANLDAMNFILRSSPQTAIVIIGWNTHGLQIPFSLYVYL